MDDLEKLWSTLLSGEAGAVRRAWNDLTDDEAQAVADHLKRMLDDEQFSQEQREAARVALEAIRKAG